MTTFLRSALSLSLIASIFCLVSSGLPYVEATTVHLRLKAQYDEGHAAYIRENFDLLISGRDAKDRFVIEALDDSPAGRGLVSLRDSSMLADEARHRRAVEALLGALWLVVTLIGLSVECRLKPEGKP